MSVAPLVHARCAATSSVASPGPTCQASQSSTNRSRSCTERTWPSCAAVSSPCEKAYSPAGKAESATWSAARKPRWPAPDVARELMMVVAAASIVDVRSPSSCAPRARLIDVIAVASVVVGVLVVVCFRWWDLVHHFPRAGGAEVVRHPVQPMGLDHRLHHAPVKRQRHNKLQRLQAGASGAFLD